MCFSEHILKQNSFLWLSVESWEKKNALIHSASNSEQEIISFDYGPLITETGRFSILQITFFFLWTEMVHKFLSITTWESSSLACWVNSKRNEVGNCVVLWPLGVLHASYKDLNKTSGHSGRSGKLLSGPFRHLKNRLRFFFFFTMRMPGQVSSVLNLIKERTPHDVKVLKLVLRGPHTQRLTLSSAYA